MKRIAVLVGGPLDGHAMALSQDRHPSLLLPVRGDVLVDLNKASGADLLAPYALAQYDWQPIGGLPRSMVDLFVFNRLE